MKNIKAILEGLGIEVPAEQEEALTKEVAANYKTAAEFEKKVGSLTAERDALQTQFDEVKAKLAGFDGVDVEDLKKQIAEAQQATKAAEEKAAADMKARDYADAVKAQVEGLTFSSNAAKAKFIEDLTAKNLSIEGGKLLGFDDYVKAYKAADAGAILDKEAEDNKAVFTQSMQSNSKQADPKSVEEKNKMRAVMGLPPIKE